jgi:hypothetical protein
LVTAGSRIANLRKTFLTCRHVRRNNRLRSRFRVAHADVKLISLFGLPLVARNRARFKVVDPSLRGMTMPNTLDKCVELLGGTLHLNLKRMRAILHPPA